CRHPSMKILYIMNVRIPTDRAHGLQVMKTCEALVQAGAEVELVIPNRKNDTDEDAFLYYGLTTAFSIRRLPAVDLLRWRVPFAFSILGFTFFLSLRKYLKHISPETVLYVRGEI